MSDDIFLLVFAATITVVLPIAVNIWLSASRRRAIRDAHRRGIGRDGIDRDRRGVNEDE